jgi:hypothetical protein
MEFGQTLCYTFLQRTMTHFGGIYPAVSVSTQDMKRKMFEMTVRSKEELDTGKTAFFFILLES